MGDTPSLLLLTPDTPSLPPLLPTTMPLPSLTPTMQLLPLPTLLELMPLAFPTMVNSFNISQDSRPQPFTSYKVSRKGRSNFRQHASGSPPAPSQTTCDNESLQVTT